MSSDDLPLLERSGRSQSPALSVDPILKRRRQSKSSKLTPCRFLLALLILAGGSVFAVIVFFMVKGLWQMLESTRFPHRDHHLHPKNWTEVGEGGLVRSFYGSESDGGVERFDLIASVYWRQKVANETSSSAGERLELAGELEAIRAVVDDTVSSSKAKEAQLMWGPWERVYSQVVQKDLTVRSKGIKSVSKVVLPARILPSLRNSTQEVALYGVFHVIPSSLEGGAAGLIPLNSTHYFNPTVTSTTLPRPWPIIGNTLEDQKTSEQPEDSWRLRMLRYPASQSLLRVLVNETLNAGDLDLAKAFVEKEEEDKKKKEPEGKSYALVMRSQVTMIEDSPVYALELFQEQMKKQGKLRTSCAAFDGKPFHPTFCNIDFNRLGHFQSLYQLGTPEDALVWEAKEAERKLAVEVVEGSEKEEGVVEVEKEEAKGWRYGPFIQATLGGAGPRDIVFFPNATDVTDEEPDFDFDWHITFSLLTPLKASIASTFSNGFHGGSISNNRSDHTIAKGQDHAEWINALAGHPFDPTTRPLTRKALRTLSSFLTFVSFLFHAHFWCTRILTAGISMPAHTIDSIYGWIAFLWQSIYAGDVQWDFIFPLVFVTICEAVILSLALRLEWSWWGWFPIWFTRRKATHSERASTRVDMRFTWAQRGLCTLAIFSLSLSLPHLPHLISASPPHPEIAPAGTLRFPKGSLLAWFYPALDQTFFMMVFLAQFLLNERSHTFGAAYRIQAVVEFVSELVHVLPVVLSGKMGGWGRWETMDPWEVSDLVRLVMQGGTVWQAWRFGGVRQEEEGEE